MAGSVNVSSNPWMQSFGLRTGYDYNDELPPEVALEQQALDRRQQLANMLLQRGLQPQQGQMVGRFYVPPSPLQGLAGLATLATGLGIGGKIDEERVGLSKTMDKQRKEEMAEYIRATSPKEIQAPIAQMGGQFPVTKAELPDETVGWDVNELQGGPTTGFLRVPPLGGNLPGEQTRQHQMESPAIPERERYGMEPTTQTLPMMQAPTPEDQRLAITKGLMSSNRWVRDAVKTMEMLKAQQAEKEANRTFLVALAGKKQEGAETLEDKKAANAKDLKKVVSGDALVSQAGQNERTDLGKIKETMKLLGIDPESPDGQKVLRDLQTKLSTHQAAASTTVNVDQGIPFVKELQSKTAGKVSDTHEAAQVASQSLVTIQRIEDAIKTGKVITGPTATPQIYIRQLGEVLGIGGTTNEEVLTNTRKAIQGMAQLQINMSKQAQGQGAISDYERRLFEKASAGADLTNVEIQELMQGMKKVANYTIAMHKRNVGLIKGLPKGGEVIAPFLELPGDDTSNAGWGIKKLE